MEEVIVAEGESWEHEALHEKLGIDIFRMSGRSPLRVKLRLGVMAKNLLVEEYPLAERDLHWESGAWLLESEVYNYEGGCRFYRGIASEAQIVDSPDFQA